MKRITKKSRSLRPALVAAVAAIALMAGGAYIYQSGSAQAEQNQAAAPQAPKVEVETLRPQAQRLWNEFSGRLAAIDSVELRPRVSGTITEVKFEDGQQVKEGDVLFVIDTRPFEANLAEAKATLASAQSRAELARLELNRTKPLVAKGHASQSLLDNRRNDYRTAQAAIKAAEAQLKQAELDLDFANIKAPISGRVGRPELTKGNVVQAGLNAPLLTTIVSDDAIYAEFDVDEQTYLQNKRDAKSGDRPVEMRLASDPNTVYKGEIYSFDNRLDPTSGTIRARAIFKGQGDLLVPGMYADVRMGTAKAESILLVSDKAVSTDQDKKFVYVINDDNQVEYRQVVLGKTIENKRVVLKGLEAGEQVMVNSLMRVRPGMAVQPTDIAGTVPNNSGVTVGEAEKGEVALKQ
jgi:multidrug efflux system membrane fusion protein